MRSQYLRSTMPIRPPAPPPKPKRRIGRLFVTAVIIMIAAAGVSAWQSSNQPKSERLVASSDMVEKQTAPTPISQPCRGNSLDKYILVSISNRRLWLCENSRQVYQAPIISGMEAHAETETPIGTYKIYGKMRNTTLTGEDSTGKWRRGVYYWMPFLDNKYGTYGFHDATWRPVEEFGKIDPHSDKGSHGCVELTYGVQKRIYEWAPVGTTVKVIS